MNKINRYFNKLLELNAVQLSLKSDNSIKYIMASGREFIEKSKPTIVEIRSMLNEILNGQGNIDDIEKQVSVQYDIPEKASFTGLIGKNGEEIFASFVLLERYKTTPKREEMSFERVIEEEESKSMIDIDVSMKEGEAEINKYLKLLVKNKGSDIHICSEEYPFIRKDGRLLKIKELPLLKSEKIQEMIKEIVSEEDMKKLNDLEELDFSYEIENMSRFRCNVFKDKKGMGAVFRLIPFRIPTFDELNLPNVLKDICFLNKGLVLVTGPTGSGKSTTLSAIIDFINKKRDVHIITLEDPIEFVHMNMKALINQREVKKHTLSFNSALKSALREDPDVVLVGEMRDLETISIALETAETGHLVFATLHTTSAYSTVNRIVEQFPPDQQEQIKTMVADSLKAVVSQTLCRKIGGGRVAAFEILLVSQAVSNLVREGKTYQITSIIQTRKKEGMISLNDYLMSLVDRNLIETYEAYLRSVDKKGMIGLLKSKEYKTDFLSKLDMLDS
jgi:twitching motility protein PilT